MIFLDIMDSGCFHLDLWQVMTFLHSDYHSRASRHHALTSTMFEFEDGCSKLLNDFQTIWDSSM